jgi:hypothetical protein
MTGKRITVEECARRILQREIDRPVIRHDDGSEPGMYDLRIGPADAPNVAIECVGAVDPTRTETWNVGPARGPLSLALRGDWYVKLLPHSRLKDILRRIEDVLRAAEEAQVEDHTSVDLYLKHRNPRLFAVLDDLNIASIYRLCLRGRGTVFLGMTGIGGAVDPSGHAVPGWISEFLRAPERADVLVKLSASGAAERHVFVAVAFAGVPWPVESYLGTCTDSLPIDAPDAPPPVSAVGIMYGRRGLRWDGRKWTFFDATVPPERDQCAVPNRTGAPERESQDEERESELGG